MLRQFLCAMNRATLAEAKRQENGSSCNVVCHRRRDRVEGVREDDTTTDGIQTTLCRLLCFRSVTFPLHLNLVVNPVKTLKRIGQTSAAVITKYIPENHNHPFHSGPRYKQKRVLVYVFFCPPYHRPSCFRPKRNFYPEGRK